MNRKKGFMVYVTLGCFNYFSSSYSCCLALITTSKLCLRNSRTHWRITVEHTIQIGICIFCFETLFLIAIVSKQASKYKSSFISSMYRSSFNFSFCQYSLTVFSSSFRFLPQIQHLVFFVSI